MKRFLSFAAVIGVSVGGLAVPAYASTTGMGVRSAIDRATARYGGASVMDVAGVKIPSDPSNGIVVSSQSNRITIGLPGAKKKWSRPDKDGTMIYDGSAGSSLAAQPLSDGGVRALITITGPSAPTTYRFPLTVPNGAALIVDHEDGRARSSGRTASRWQRSYRPGRPTQTAKPSRHRIRLTGRPWFRPSISRVQHSRSSLTRTSSGAGGRN